MGNDGLFRGNHQETRDELGFLSLQQHTVPFLLCLLASPAPKVRTFIHALAEY